ncbi:MAG: metal ABC transporter substrate-binding protein [Acidimicrobiia bacterium]
MMQNPWRQIGSTRARRFLVVVVTVSLMLAACSDAEPPDGGGLVIVATTTIWADVVRAIVGTDATVRSLMPPGTDPHEFQPSSEQVAAMATADLVVANGLGLEHGLEKVLDALAADGQTVLAIGPLVDPRSWEGTSCLEENACDPHVWMDPERVAAGAFQIADALAAIDPETDWNGRAREYAATMETTSDDMAEVLSSVPPELRRLVTNHDSLRYFADRFGFEVVGSVIPGGTSLGNPSSSDLADLTAVMNQEQIGVIFTGAGDPVVLAEAVAGGVEGGASIVPLFIGSLSGPEDQASSLAEMLRIDAERIAGALQ